jgi:hypothetical protein
MSDASTQQAGLAVRASDAEREQTVALLRRNFADGRLTQAELEAAYAARTRPQLRDLTADLPDQEQTPPSGRSLDRRLLYILLCVHPPAALVYWLLSRRRHPGTADSGPATTGGAPSPRRFVAGGAVSTAGRPGG